jgi:uncharacterized lipoprotein YajG
MNGRLKRAPAFAAAAALVSGCATTQQNLEYDPTATNADVPIRAVPVRGSWLR